MYRAPSRRSKSRATTKPNLTSILDAVFIFIFFLLMTSSFVKIYEITSDVPIISTKEPPKNDKPPLALTLAITENGITVYTGVPRKAQRSFGKIEDGQYDLEGLHEFLISVKKRNLDEKTIVFEPLIDLTYEDLVKIMDTARILRKTDEAIFVKDENGNDQKLELLFNNIIFGNIQS